MSTSNKVQFKAVFSRFKDVLDVVNPALSNNIDLLVIRHPHDGGPAGWQVPGVSCVIADLATDHGQIMVFDEIAARYPAAVIFTTSTERDEYPFIVEAGEAKVVQELLWRHAGKLGSIEPYFPVAASSGGVAW